MRNLLKPYQFQQEIIDKIKAYDYYALFMDCGTGKTLITINAIRNKFRKHGVMRTVIFCPLIVLKNWKQEFLMSTQLPSHMICVVDGSTKKARLKQLNNKDNIITIINYNALLTKEIAEFLEDWQPQVVVCDESHKIKSRTSKRFKAVRCIGLRAPFRYILTGTPVTNNLMDIFSQYLFLDRGAAFGDSFTAFRSRYFVDLNAAWKEKKTYFPNWQVCESLLPEVTRKLAAISVRMKKEDCLDLPEYVMQKIEVPLSEEQRKHYDQVKKELITWLDEQKDNPLVVQNALVKVLRLNEICSGYMKLEDGTIYKFKTNPRLNAAIELVEWAEPHKIIIYCVYKENYKDLVARLEKTGIYYVELHGGISSKKKIENVDLFNASNDVRVCISNPRSAGLGVNLKAAKYKAYYTRTYSLDDYEQSKARNYRAGSIDFHQKITDYNIIAPDTIDEVIFERLQSKKVFAERILDIKNML